MEHTKLEYIWIDAEGNPRTKTMIYQKTVGLPEDLPLWNFDGSSTKQATTKTSDVLMKPVALYNDPFRGAPHKLVLCETLNSDKTPHPTNNRASAVNAMNIVKDHFPQFGMEQEYFLFDRKVAEHTYTNSDGKVVKESLNIPHKWMGHNKPGSGPQGPYYCSVGGGVAFGRDFVEEHMDLCLASGIKYCGLNAEVLPSQWEFQIGICDGIEMGDHLQIARYIMHRLTEKYDIIASLHPKPYKGDWNGSGLHTNYSTIFMREGEGDKNGITYIEEACKKLCKDDKHKAHMKVYGKFNDQRLIGSHETGSFHKCTYGFSDRSKSIRIPLIVSQTGYGYLEDRRIASNADPYQVIEAIVETTISK